ncbi:MAG TPA: DPP IV N-terminal domain-containing protein [Planctomycetota bacterium]|nr:DPP IV N-terminal domain-containing protein [Planctomycetota bacterium]
MSPASTLVSSSALRCTALVSLLLAPPLAAQGQERLTWQDIRKQISWQGSLPDAKWAADGQHVEMEKGKMKVWFDPATGAEKEKPKDQPAEASATMRKVVFVDEGDLWLDERPAGVGRPVRGRGGASGAAPAKSDKAVQLTRDGAGPGKKEEVHLSPDGAFASFVRGNNLVVVDAATKEPWAVTTDGGPELFHGMLDWVYQEELYGRGSFQAHWWSPQGGMVAFLSLDEAPVREFTLVNHVPEGFLEKERAVLTEVSNYPKAGDPNPFARLSIAHTGTKKVVPVDLSSFPKDALVVRVEWTPDGKTLLAFVMDRIQTWAELCGVDPETGAVTKWIREESKTWVNRPDSPRWLADGSFLWMSERTGYQHVYHYAPKGTLLRAVTSGNWQVRSLERVDEQKQQLWFEGTKDGATGRHLYRIGLQGEGLVCVTPGVGTHAAQLNPAGTFLIDTWSAMDRRTTVRVLDAATGEVKKEIGQANEGEAAKYAFSERQRVTVKARDGYELDAAVHLPPDWKEGQRYPVFLPTYSGPDSQTVRDSWSHSNYDQFLAQQGFVILRVNVRSASGRGQVHTGTCYQQLGVVELKDLEDAVDHVCAKFGGDPARVAISGSSYGGFMAAYALTHSTKFALGLAGSGVYDWQLYDTIYTERYMRTPQENKAGYDATSVIKAAKNLHGHLVITHGTMDDNVHMQNAMQLVWELQIAGKQNFEVMFYPRTRHGIGGRVGGHNQEFQWLRLKKLLEPVAKAG